MWWITTESVSFADLNQIWTGLPSCYDKLYIDNGFYDG